MKIDTQKKLIVAAVVALLLVVADQWFKYWVRENIGHGDSIEITSWFKLCFVENPGAAFGMQFGPKIFLTLFRIVAVGFLGYYTYKVIKMGFPFAFALALTLVTAGAFGNIIDCVFYARIFDGGDFFVGKVVDMLYFPIVRTTWPDWTPWAGQSLVFFRPVFNLADSGITCGVFYMLFFHMKDVSRLFELSFSEKDKDKVEQKETNTSENE